MASSEEKNNTFTIKVDASKQKEPLNIVWHYYGYDECNYSTADNAKKLMRGLIKINQKPVFLRKHYLLVSEDGPPDVKWGWTNVYKEDNQGNPVYNWKIMDEIMDAVTSTGCLPLVEIGFMPKALTAYKGKYRLDTFSKVGGGAHYPPKDYKKWAGLIYEWALHSKKRYGDKIKEWKWQLWNEPAGNYFKGTTEEFCKLYDYTEQALHEVLPNAILGAPHVASVYRNPRGVSRNEDFLRDFLKHCSQGTNYVTGKKGTRLDYVGFHSKGRTQIYEGHVRMNLGRNLECTRNAFKVIQEFPEYSKLPVIIGECDPEGGAARLAPQNGYRNGSAYAACTVAMMKYTLDIAKKYEMNLEGVCTWAFMFKGSKYFEGFRTLSTNGINKPVFNAFKMLGMLKGTRNPLQSSGSLGLDYILEDGFRDNPDIDGIAYTNDLHTRILIWNYHDDMVESEPAQVELKIKAPEGIKGSEVSVRHYRIDDSHSNAYTCWLKMGSPQNPTKKEIETLHQASNLALLEKEEEVKIMASQISLNFHLPRYGVSLLEIQWV